MVRVEAPPITDTPLLPPPRDRTTLWLAASGIALLAIAPLPWERWCDTTAIGDLERCFSAQLWGGSASLLGLAALLLIVAFLATSVGRLRERPGTPRIVLFAGVLACTVGKLAIVTDNDFVAVRYSGSTVSTFAIGFFIAILVAIVAFGALLAAFDFQLPRPRLIIAAIVTCVAVGVLAVTYARSGLAWWGGPLAWPGQLGGGNGSGHVVRPGEPHLFAHLLFIQNRGRSPVTLDGLDVVEGSPELSASEAYVFESPPCSEAALDISFSEAPIGTCVYHLTGHRVEPSDGHTSVLLGFTYEVPAPGVYRSGWFRIRYHAGPLSFEVFRTDQLVICAPEPEKKRCPGDGF